MTKKTRYFLILLFSTLILVIGSIVAINYFLKNKVEQFLKNRLPNHIVQSYDNLQLNITEGTLTLTSPTVFIKNKNDNQTHTEISAEKLIIEDISYWNYLINHKIQVDEIEILSPTIVYHKHKLNKERKDVKSGVIKMNRPLFLDKLKINDARLTIYDGTKDSVLLFTEHFSMEVDSITTNKDLIKKRLPIAYGDYTASTDTIFVKVSDFENATVKNLNLQDKDVTIKGVHLFTKYSRQEHARLLRKERDHFDLNVDSLVVKNVDFGFKKRILSITGDKIFFENPFLDIYRNKLLPDDTTIKPLYSKMLRDLSFNLTLDSIKINNAEIVYTEKVKKDNQGGKINFKNLNASISNVSNTYKDPVKTTIAIDAVFMKNTPFTTQWTFDVNDPNDRFLFKANVGSLQAPDINSFTIPNLKVQLEGEANKTYFTIDGNHTRSQVDLKINYDQFKVSVLNKEGNKKNGILSAIANIFISKDSNKSDQQFRKGSGEVTRDKTKSFFNYLWLNVSKGLKSGLTGGKN